MDTYRQGLQNGTGASIDIPLGWIPEKVVVTNIEASDVCRVEWLLGMTAGHGLKYLTTTDRDLSKITSLGITPLGDGASDTIRGFRIGADTDLNVDGEQLVWEAYRSAEPNTRDATV